MEQNIVIEVKNVFKKFGEQQALDNVNMICRRGSITGIMGRNGSGKSVLLKCMCGFLQPDKGEIYIYGKKNTEFLKSKHSLGAIIESPAFLERYSGLKNLSLLYGVLNPIDKGHLRSVMESVGLNPDSRKKVKRYSMGMKQRLAIAQAIMEDQEVLLLDEPMNGLDIEGVERIRELFLELKENGKTIVMTTHNREDVEKICDCTYEMVAGKLQKEGESEFAI